VDLADVSARLTSEQSKSYEEYVHLVLSAGVTSWSVAVGFTVNQDMQNGTKSLSHDVAYTDGLRLEGWFRPE